MPLIEDRCFLASLEKVAMNVVKFCLSGFFFTHYAEGLAKEVHFVDIERLKNSHLLIDIIIVSIKLGPALGLAPKTHFECNFHGPG